MAQPGEPIAARLAVADCRDSRSAAVHSGIGPRKNDRQARSRPAAEHPGRGHIGPVKERALALEFPALGFPDLELPGLDPVMGSLWHMAACRHPAARTLVSAANRVVGFAVGPAGLEVVAEPDPPLAPVAIDPAATGPVAAVDQAVADLAAPTQGCSSPIPIPARASHCLLCETSFSSVSLSQNSTSSVLLWLPGPSPISGRFSTFDAAHSAGDVSR